MAKLPRAVHLVAEAPDRHAVGLGGTVGGAHVGMPRPCLAIAVFHPVAGLFRRARAEVHRQHRLPIELAAKLDELVGAEGVGFDGLPGKLPSAGARLLGAHAVLPVIAGGEVAARIANDGEAKLPQRLDDVGAHPVGIGVNAAGVVHALVNGATQVLEKTAEDKRAHGADGVAGVKVESGGLGHGAACPAASIDRMHGC